MVASRRPPNQKAPTQRKRVALMGRGSRLLVSPWQQPPASPSYEGAGPGLPQPWQNGSRAVPSLEVQAFPHRLDPSSLLALWRFTQRCPILAIPALWSLSELPPLRWSN